MRRVEEGKAFSLSEIRGGVRAVVRGLDFVLKGGFFVRLAWSFVRGCLGYYLGESFLLWGFWVEFKG